MKKSKKIILIILAVFCCLIMFGNTCNADTKVTGADTILQQGKDFITDGKTASNGIITEDQFAEAIIPVGQVLVGIATVVIAVVMAIMGIKWITATPEQQAKLKQQLIGLVIAIVVIYGAVGIWTLVRNIMESVTGEDTTLSTVVIQQKLS